MLKRAITPLLLAAGLAPLAAADVLNGDFDTGNLNNWTVNGTAYARQWEMSRDFLPPVHADWTPQEGSYFASLWSHNNNPGAPVTTTTMSQTFVANAGDYVSFWYFFDWGDVAPFYDTAQVTLTYGGGTLTVLDLNGPGNRLPDDGKIEWTPRSYLLPANDTYTLTFSITDFGVDFESLLGVDAVYVPEPGTLVALVAAALFAARRRRA